MIEPIELLWNAMSKQPFKRSLPGSVADFFFGKNILITGSSGFLARHIIQMLSKEVSSPGAIIGIDLVSADSQADMQPTVFYQGRCGDQGLLNQIFSHHSVDIVIHCAAEKHLPQLQNDPLGALIRNTSESIKFLAFCLGRGVKDLLYVSTDKATQPKSVYGASKYFPELYLRAVAASYPQANISCIRLGNIFGSSGSVLQQWSAQFVSERAITVRGQGMQRIFVSPRQAALYCLCALELAQDHQQKSGARILRFGPTVQTSWSIEQLAHNWLTQKNISEPQAHIHHAPALAGEKHSEIIWCENDAPVASKFPELSYVVEAAELEIDMDKALSTLEVICTAAQTDSDSNSNLNGKVREIQAKALAWITDHVPEFAP